MGAVRDADPNRLLILIISELKQLHCHMDCWNRTVIEKPEIGRAVPAHVVVDPEFRFEVEFGCGLCNA